MLQNVGEIFVCRKINLRTNECMHEIRYMNTGFRFLTVVKVFINFFFTFCYITKLRVIISAKNTNTECIFVRLSIYTASICTKGVVHSVSSSSSS